MVHDDWMFLPLWMYSGLFCTLDSEVLFACWCYYQWPIQISISVTQVVSFVLPLRTEMPHVDLTLWFLCVKALVYSLDLLNQWTCPWFEYKLERYRGNSCCLFPPIKMKHKSGVNLTNWSIILFVRSVVSTGITVAAGWVYIFSGFPQRAFGDSWARSGGGGEWAHDCSSLSVFLSLSVCLSAENSQLWPAASFRLAAAATAPSDSTPQIFPFLSSRPAILSVWLSISKCFLLPHPH